jgi:hypothetical protein
VARGDHLAMGDKDGVDIAAVRIAAAETFLISMSFSACGGVR